MPLTHFPNGISSFGIPVMGGGGIPATPGNIIWVDYGTGSDGVSLKANSASRPFKTLDAAYDQARTNKDDVIALIGNTTHTLTEMLTVAKNRVHFVGVDGSGGRMYGQNAKVALGVTTAATDLGAMLNTGIRNSFTNIKFISTNTQAASLYSVLESGEYAVYSNCEIYKETDLDETTAAELVLNGDSAQFFGCTIGSLANAQTGTTIRPCVKLARGTAPSGTAQMRECYMESCRLLKNSGHTTSAFVYAAADADVERSLELNGCLFINAKNSAAVPAQAVASAASLTVGGIYLHNCGAFNVTKVSTTTGVFISSAAGAATGGLAAQAA